MVANAPLPEKSKNDLALYVSCVAGALYVEDLKKMLRKAGFAEITIRFEDSKHESSNACARGTSLEGYVASALIEAVKPMTAKNHQLLISSEIK